MKYLHVFTKMINFVCINNRLKILVMTTKLTLTIEQHIIEKAKEYAKNRGRSLSDIIENYLKAVVDEKEVLETDIAPITKSLKGSFKKTSDFDYKKQLNNRLTEKYLK